MLRSVATLVSVMAFTACGTGTLPPPAAVSAADIHLAADTTLVRGIVPRNATMAAMLREAGLATEAVDRLIAAARTVFDPRRFRALQPFALERTLEGALRYFEYEIDRDSFLRVAPAAAAADPLRAEVLPIPKTLQHAAVAGRIDSAAPSLFQSMDAAGESGDLAVALAEIFSGEIDFTTELQPGDRYAVTFERFHREGRPPSYGVVTAAQFENDGRVLHAIRFTPPGGKADYFDERGRSLRRFFLRSPLKFEPRVTSGFSLRRMHPVLHTSRAHRGVDYAAATGSAVVAVAVGSVVSATYDNANGRMVRLRHPSGYESYYLHLSAIAPGIRRGAPVAQGQTVGRVGASGLATGPHLHYGLRKNGAFVNPLREHRNLPPGEPVPTAAMPAFAAERDHAVARLGSTIGSAGAPAGAPAR